MILYLDSSALVKLYVAEQDSDDVERWVAEAVEVWTSIVTFSEVSAGLARRLRDGTLAAPHHQQAMGEFCADWPHLNIVTVDQAVTQSGGALALRHALRGFDAIHLACALNVQAVLGETRVAVYDRRLRLAVAASGLTLAE